MGTSVQSHAVSPRSIVERRETIALLESCNCLSKWSFVFPINAAARIGHAARSGVELAPNEQVCAAAFTPITVQSGAERSCDALSRSMGFTTLFILTLTGVGRFSLMAGFIALLPFQPSLYVLSMC
jgi:hypothetical protein